MIIVFGLTACESQDKESSSGSKLEKYKNIYTVSVHNTEENESTAKYLEIAQHSAELFPLLEDNSNAKAYIRILNLM